MNELWLVLGNRPCNQRAPEKKWITIHSKRTRVRRHTKLYGKAPNQ